MGQAFGLKEVYQVIRRRVVLLSVVTLLVVIIGIAISLLLPRTYEGEGALLVNFTSVKSDEDEISSSEIETNLRLIETYKSILISPRIMDKVKAQYGSDLEMEELVQRFTIGTNAESQIITVQAVGPSKEAASELVNVTLDTFQQEVESLMNLNNVQILTRSNPDAHETPIKPNLLMNTILSLLLGLFLALLLVFLKEVIFTRADSEEKVEKVFRLSSLGVVPIISDEWNQKKEDLMQNDRYFKLLPRLGTYSPITEAYRSIRTNLQYTLNQKSAKTVLFTSTHSSEGKSITAANIAYSMAMDHVNTVFVDLDLRKGVGNHLFNNPVRKGATNYLEGYASIDEVVSRTDIPHLSYVAKGPMPKNPAEVLSSDKINTMLAELKEHFDLVIIDTPPLVVADAVALSTRVDGCVFVVNAQKTNTEQVSKSLQRLNKVKATIFGVVLNRGVKETNAHYYY
ncbi:hypothetical protein N781_14200 [Pontibacillus halophilus JSM 076056 = DSM 19796]|uniref:Polysaccharide chain length determinant N-terminal domain-containing protein n=1 Tax=Pontibacillus halophilus JSM 076056 = DSM 19796 TaxID=1385510 RepID=A0A0A5GPA9_9BACI|nr:polysaccharide biosynthesis tyrosine autokinase [Pontibacillus halophilus]KGX93063.1 hypothetical protein N781_14200 [Pontibacillus halophilus JSM 076056 = DSM 19796]